MKNVLELFWKRCLMKTAAAPAKGNRGGGGGGGGRGGAGVAEPEAELDENGNPIEGAGGGSGDGGPELDENGNPIEGDDAQKFDKDGNPIEGDGEPELDENGNPIEGDGAGGEEEPDPRDQKIEELTARLDAIEKGGGKGKEEPKPWGDEEWTKLMERWELTPDADGNPRNFGKTALQGVMQMMMGQRQEFRDMLQAEMSGFKKEAAIADLSWEKGFEDIKGYRKGMEEFLKDFSPGLHSDKNLLKKALIYSRGLGASGKFRKALNDKEKNRRINAGGVHGKAAPGKGGGGKSVVLSAEQKAAAKSSGMSEQEYIKYLTIDNLEDIALPE